MKNRIHNFKSFISLNESKSDGTSIIIGDSCTPNIFKRSKTLTMLGTTGSEENLWKGGIGVKWLKTAVSKHPVETKVKDVVINIGTNGAFGPNDDIKGLMVELKRVFPQAKFSAVQGSWGWGGNISVTPDKVKKYYDRFKAEGVTVIEPPIGKVADPHSNLPVYDTIAKEIDGLVTNQSGYIAPSDLGADSSATTQIISRPGDVYSYKVKDDHWLAKKDSQSRWYEITGADFKPAYQVSVDTLDKENPNMRSKNAPKKGGMPGSGTVINKDNQTKDDTNNITGGGNIGKVTGNIWSNEGEFFNTEGKNLLQLGKGVGITLTRNKGLNSAFSEDVYIANKNNPKVYWAIYDISNNRLLGSSANATKNVYGASIPKVCVAAAAFDNNNGVLPKDSDYQKVIKLLVKSDNNVWTYLQDLAGGKDAVNNWDKKMGYKMQSARTGGNSANAIDMCKFFNDVIRNNFKGAETIFKITSSCGTDSGRGRKCMPKEVFMGGKTGTFARKDKSVDVNHDCCWVRNGDKFYSISVLTDQLGSSGNNVIAQMFRGLYNEYA